MSEKVISSISLFDPLSAGERALLLDALKRAGFVLSAAQQGAYYLFVGYRSVPALAELSLQKFSSNVIEKCLQAGDSRVISMVTSEVTSAKSLGQLLHDKGSLEEATPLLREAGRERYIKLGRELAQQVPLAFAERHGALEAEEVTLGGDGGRTCVEIV